MDRRSFLKTLALATGAVAMTGEEAFAAAKETRSDSFAVLVDTTLCAGCRSCEEACAEAHDLPVPDTDDESVFEALRETSETQWSVVNRFVDEEEDEERFVKRQCMHCDQPACAAACPTKAMLKTEEGPVIWRADKCMGCRFCMISCPFNIPKFEYDSPVPKIQKCRFCWEELSEGKLPACVEACPNDALLFGKRDEVLEVAKERIYQDPDDYVHHVYGEHEVGGTSWLYLSAVPFEDLAFPTNLGTTAIPEYTKGFLYSVPVVLILWPMFLLGLRLSTRREAPIAPGEEE